jgi:MOSC domain-containing protein YiiM
MARLLSVNIGRPEKIGSRRAPSGINKQPALSARITTLGVVGDAVLETKHHGGPEQAVYLYFRHDYAYWEEVLGRTLRPGMFGENLTLEGIDATDLAVGDRFAIGDVLLEVSYHRTPCATFAAQMDDPLWVKQFHEAGRPGAYARVLAEGDVHPGDVVRYLPFDGPKVRVSALMALDGRRDLDAATMRWALSAPLRLKTREKYSARLAELEAAR